jgi:hypothetical protein
LGWCGFFVSGASVAGIAGPVVQVMECSPEITQVKAISAARANFEVVADYPVVGHAESFLRQNRHRSLTSL